MYSAWHWAVLPYLSITSARGPVLYECAKDTRVEQSVSLTSTGRFVQILQQMWTQASTVGPATVVRFAPKDHVQT